MDMKDLDALTKKLAVGGAAGIVARLMGRAMGHERGRQDVVESIPDIMDALRDSHRVILFVEKEMKVGEPGTLATRGLITSNIEFLEEVIVKLLDNVTPSFVFKAWLRKLRPGAKKNLAEKDAEERAAFQKKLAERALGGITAAEVAEKLSGKKEGV